MLKSIYKNYKKAYQQSITLVSGIFAIPGSRNLEKKFSSLINEKPTAYDIKIDEIYNASHIGGGYHRHFDESHTPLLMWEKVKETFPNDTFTEEIKNYFISFAKDLQTINGIPLFNIDNKAAFDSFAEKLSSYNVSKSWLLDFTQINMAEVFTTSIGAIALIFNWNEKDKTEFKSEISSSLVLSSFVAANPILFTLAIISFAATFTKKKTQKEFKRGAVAGISTTGSFIATASIFTNPLLGIIFGLIIASAVKRNLVKYRNKNLIPALNSIVRKNRKYLVGSGLSILMLTTLGIEI